jgi:hypothetical protein
LNSQTGNPSIKNRKRQRSQSRIHPFGKILCFDSGDF